MTWGSGRPIKTPKVYVAMMIVMSITMFGSAKNVAIVFQLVPLPEILVAIVVIAINITGSNDEIKLLAVPGSLSSLRSCMVNTFVGFVFIFFRVFAYRGPAIMTAGIAMMIP